MTLKREWTRIRRALHRPPGYVIARIGRELAMQARRPWDRLRPHLFTESTLLRKAGAASIDELWQQSTSGGFLIHHFQRDAWVSRFRDAFPDGQAAIIAAAERVMRHEFDLLGSGPTQLGPQLPWHVDFKSGHQWPMRWCQDFDANELDRPSDVKVPWELSRCQHLPLLGQAWWLTGDDRYAREFVAEIDDWIARNPFAMGINWACPMDVALRAINWIWALHFFADAAPCAAPAFRSRLLRLLYLHGEFVAAHPEMDEVNGNHYLSDAVGLIYIGLLFRQIPEAAGWLDAGTRMVRAEIEQQTHDDGTGIEQSIAYHRLVVELFLAAGLRLRAAGVDLPGTFWARLERMHEFVAAYIKPDGLAPLVGDADDGRVQTLGLQTIGDHRYLLSTAAALFEREDFKRVAGRFWEESFWLLGPDGLDRYTRLAERSGVAKVHAFASGGFYVLRGDHAFAFVDCAEVGFKGRGGHGHNDVLSFELSFGRTNIVTDSGAYLYTSSRDWRNRFRSTAYHNTVQVDGEELNRFTHPDELWRLRYDAVPIDVRHGESEAWQYVGAAHRGYERLADPIAHRRTVIVHQHRAGAVVADRLTGRGRHRFTWRFHLDPSVQAVVHGDRVQLTTPAGAVWLACVQPPPALTISLEEGWMSPRFGLKQARAVVVAETCADAPLDCVWTFTGIEPGDVGELPWRAAIEECA